MPEAWTQLKIAEWRGTVLVIGAPDVGKTTLAQYIQRVAARERNVGYVDGDPGQSTLGPPTTITLALGGGQVRRWFVGHVSPRGHMLPLVSGARRLLDAALELGANLVVFDTCGLVDPRQGGFSLKWALIGMLRPAVVIALQRERELEGLLVPLRLSRRAQIIDVPASPYATPRDANMRRANRAAHFARYFGGAGLIDVHWGGLGVVPGPHFPPGRVAALEDEAGFTLALGQVMGENRPAQTVTLRTPLTSTRNVSVLRLGDIALDMDTFEARY